MGSCETLGFIGFGRVGEATANIFQNKKVYWYDKYREGSERLETVVQESDVVFVALPTPADFQGLCIDLTIMDEAMEAIARVPDSDGTIVVVKSTVVPGTTLGYEKKYPHLKLVMSPEYLTDANYLHDALHPDRIVFGSNDGDALDTLFILYRDRFPEVSLFKTNPTSAEFAKYANNILLATKVAFSNAMGSVANRLSDEYELVDYNDDIVPILVADSRVGPTHLTVSEERGFGGKCFPKDLVALIGLATDLGGVGGAGTFLQGIWDYNLSVRRVRDWEEIPGADSRTTASLYGDA